MTKSAGWYWKHGVLLSDGREKRYHTVAESGEIQFKINAPKRELADYFYHDKTGNIHNLGKIKLKKVLDKYGGTYKDKLGDSSYVFLTDIRDVKPYSKDGVIFRLAINTDSARYYLNDVTLA